MSNLHKLLTRNAFNDLHGIADWLDGVTDLELRGLLHTDSHCVGTHSESTCLHIATSD
jgi:hypothetical protein